MTKPPRHPLCLIRVFAVRMKKAWVLSYPLSAQRRLWSDWVDVQADLSLQWAHNLFVGFVMSRFICSSEIRCWFRVPLSEQVTGKRDNAGRMPKTNKTDIIIVYNWDMTKPTKCVCAQRRLRSAWASAQSDQSLRCPHEESLGPELPTERTAKTLMHSEDSDQTGRMPRLTWVFAGRTLTLLVLSCRGSSSVTIPHPSLHTAVSQHLYISTTGFVRTIFFPPRAFEITAIRKFIYFILFIYLFFIVRTSNNAFSKWTTY